MVALVDVVVVSYNSRAHLRACVGPLAVTENLRVVVVDNRSTDGSAESVADLPLEIIAAETNEGFARGCNIGWRVGEAPFVLFLNPDAAIDPESVLRLARIVDSSQVGAVAPKIVHPDGALHFSQRRFPHLSSLYAQALFLHRIFPHANWSDEVIRTREAYAAPGSPDWVSGACVMVKRSTLEEVNGLDENFFMYWEDTDLCRRLRSHGLEIRYEPAAVAVHVGGASAPRAELLPVLAASRIRYSRKHRTGIGVAAERLGIALGALTHIIISRGGVDVRAGHARALRQAVSKEPVVGAGA
jgi:N-acetylglucosaminyl-diphospho-decaprenol L-rhamnosyltransferase